MAIDDGAVARARPVLQMRGISKGFPGVQALDDVSLELHAGEVLGLVGVNGAGKSTLMNVLGGVVPRDSGEILLDGEPVSLSSPRESRGHGIAFVHQELSLFPNLDVAANICTADLSSGQRLLSRRDQHRRAREALVRVGLRDMAPHRLVGTLRQGERQLVEIARALDQHARIVVLDEATSSLSDAEVAVLFSLIRQLTSEGVSVIYLSHRMEEIGQICDRVTVLRDSRLVGSLTAHDLDGAQVVRMMLGRELAEQPVPQQRDTGRVLLRVDGLRRAPTLHDVSFEVRAGEVLGLCGLLGSGRSETLRCLFGLDRREAGTVTVDGVPVELRSPQNAIEVGFGFITEDRRTEGLLLERSIRDNVVLADLRHLARGGVWMRPDREDAAAERHLTALRIKAPRVTAVAGFLSGGNQQKVVLAKWLQTRPRILLLDEPTRGIDVGAKEEVYRLVNELATAGAAIVVVSSEVPELMRLSDRIAVIRGGRITTTLRTDQTSAHDVMLAAAGGDA